MNDWWTHLLSVGGLSLAVPTVILLICLKYAWPAFAEDYPADIQALLPEPTKAETRWSWVLAPAFMITLIAALVYTTASWESSELSFFDAWLMALGAVVLFCLIDIVIVDWLVVCLWRPIWWVVPRGTEDAEGWKDYMFHVKAQFSPKGIAVLVIGPFVIAGIAQLFI